MQTGKSALQQTRMDRWPGRPSRLVHFAPWLKSRWSHSGMSGSMKETPHRSWMLRPRWGVASRMSLRHLPTNAGQGRPAEIQRCCGRKPQHCLRCEGVIPRMGPRAVPGITHVGLDDSRLLRIGFDFSSARAGSILGPALFSSADGHRLKR
jgi:hypothetical protein